MEPAVTVIAAFALFVTVRSTVPDSPALAVSVQETTPFAGNPVHERGTSPIPVKPLEAAAVMSSGSRTVTVVVAVIAVKA